MSVWLPKWSVDRFRRCERRSRDSQHDERPLLLIDRSQQRQVVMQSCERADEYGVAPCMPAAQARALFPPGGVRIEAYDTRSDSRALDALALWAMRFSPLVQIDPPDGLLFDVTGCERVFDGEPALARKASDALHRLGIRCRLAITPTFASAWALARHGQQASQIVDPGSLRSALSPLGVASLAIDEDTRDALAELGIERVAHLLDLPRSTLPARFGDSLLLRLDQALGHAIEAFEPMRPVAQISAAREFEGPTDRVEAIEITVGELLNTVADELQAREQGARCIETTLIRSDLPPETITIRMGRPSRDPVHLWKLLAPKLERAHLGFGVEGVSVEAVSVARVRHEQQHTAIGDNAEHGSIDRAVGDLVDTLANRLGSDRVFRPALLASHLPEQACSVLPADESPPRLPFSPSPNDRPTILFERPEAATVVALTPDGPVHSLRWRDEDHTVIACVGPERLGSEWWRALGSTRDYFRIQIESGRWLWLARSLEGNRWFVHGAWA